MTIFLIYAVGMAIISLLLSWDAEKEIYQELKKQGYSNLAITFGLFFGRTTMLCFAWLIVPITAILVVYEKNQEGN